MCKPEIIANEEGRVKKYEKIVIYIEMFFVIL